MVYEVTVDYVTTTTVLVEAEDVQPAVDKVYAYLRTPEGLDSVFQAEMENAQKHWSAFEVADVQPAPQIAPEDAEIRKERSADTCPRCGEQSDVEYGHVYAENGWAWHEATCRKCGFRYRLEYEFKTGDWEEA